MSPPPDREEQALLPGPGDDPSGESGTVLRADGGTPVLGPAARRGRGAWAPRAPTESVEVGPPVGRATEAFREGDPLGPFVLLDRIGSGGMGVVFGAYDFRLEREVAVKVLQPEALEQWGTRGRERLLREAQAMARLSSHPNVVAVYEVGVVGEQAYVAMEHVQGQTLRSWLEARPRPWRDVLEVFLQAGQGLAAAHAQGFVHRDFKPENVLVGADGVVRVTDFGLVQYPEHAAPTPGARGADEPSVPLSGATPALHARSGTLLGTPAYMAPEAYAFEPVLDARADQFSFCVALYEALWRTRPFPATTVEELRVRLLSGPPRPPPARPAVPRAVRAVVLQGLRRERAERHPSMDVLLTQLRAAMRRERARRGVRAAAAGLALLAAGALAWHRAGAPSCRGAGQALAGVWDDGVRASLRRAFLAHAVPYAPHALARVTAALDAYASAWTRTHVEACEATLLRGEQSPRVMDLRMACLERQRVAFRSLTAALTATPEVLERAADAVAQLPPLDVCNDGLALAQGVPLPSTPEARRRVQALRQALTEAEAQASLAYDEAARRRAAQVADAARELGDAQLRAEALLLQGSAHRRTPAWKGAEALLREAALWAGRAHDDRLLLQAWARLLTWYADHAPNTPGAALVRDGLEVLAARLSQDASAQVVAHNALGYFYGLRSDPARQLAAFRHALALAERHDLEQGRAEALSGVAASLVGLGRLGEARATLERSLALARARYGRGHPAVAAALERLAVADLDLGDDQAAERGLEEARAIYREGGGRATFDEARVRAQLAVALARRGRLDEALALSERAHADLARLRGPEDADAARALGILGDVLFRKGQLAAALRCHREAHALLVRRDEAGTAALVAPLMAVAEDLAATGRVRASLGWAARAVAHAERTLAPEHPLRLDVLTAQADLLLAAGQHQASCRVRARALPRHVEARPEVRRRAAVGEAACLLEGGRVTDALEPLRRAQALGAGQQPGAAVDNAAFHFLLARALWRTDADQALRLARKARRELEPPPDARGVRERRALDAWLARHAPAPRSGAPLASTRAAR